MSEQNNFYNDTSHNFLSYFMWCNLSKSYYNQTGEKAKVYGKFNSIDFLYYHCFTSRFYKVTYIFSYKDDMKKYKLQT